MEIKNVNQQRIKKMYSQNGNKKKIKLNKKKKKE